MMNRGPICGSQALNRKLDRIAVMPGNPQLLAAILDVNTLGAVTRTTPERKRGMANMYTHLFSV